MITSGAKKAPRAMYELDDKQKRTLSLLSPISKVDPAIIIPRTQLPDQLYTEIMPAEPVKIFVSGQRGMGKTTELHRFVTLLQDSAFLPVFLQFGSQQSITHSGLIKAMASALYADEDARVDDRTFNKVDEWYDDEQSTTSVEESSGGKASIGGNYVVLGASGEIAHSRTRTTKKSRIKDRSITELLGAFNAFIERTQKLTAKRIVFVVDDIDKVQDAGSISSTFIHASHIIGQLNCACIFTVPITYATSSFVRIAGLPYNGIHRVPAIDLVDDKNVRNTSAQEFMRNVFRLRMPYNPIRPEILDRVLDYSGGVLIDAMRMLRALCKRAIMNPGLEVTEAVLDEEFQHLVDDYQFVIDSRPLWDALAELCAHGGRRTVIGGLLPDLLYKMIAIEYEGKRAWFAPHPAARRLYEQNIDL